MRFAVNCNEYLVEYIDPMGHVMSKVVYANSKHGAANQVRYRGYAKRIVSVTRV